MSDKKVEDWEQAEINSLTLKMIFYATGGTLVATAISYILNATSLGSINPELLFVPWGIVLVIGVSTAFHRGVMAERNRQSKSKPKTSKSKATKSKSKKK